MRPTQVSWTVAAAARLVRAAGALDIPVLITRQYPDGLGDTVSKVHDAYAGLAEGLKSGIVDKTTFCCSREPKFVSALDAIVRGQVVLCGMETHICIVQTALALARLRAEGVVITTSEAVMYEALGRADTPAFKDILRIVKGD